MNTLRRLIPVAGLACGLLLCRAQVAPAVNLSWINAAGGFAGGAANWNPAQVPAAADWLSFALANTYTVTFGANVPASDHLGVDNGTVTFRFPTAHTNATVLGVAQIAPTAENTIESGSLTLLGNLYVAATAGHTGTLTVTGAGTSLAATSGTGVTSFGDQGTGTLNVLDGATVTIANSPGFGDRAGGTGTLVVGGVSGAERAELLVNNASGDPMELGSNGTGNGGVLLGGLLSVAGTLHLGKNAGGNGTLSVAGVSGADSATLQVNGDLKLARNDVSGTAAGTGTFYTGSGGIAEVAGTTYTSDPDGGTGKLQVSTGGRFETGSLVMSDPATQLNFAGGRLQVRGGTLDASGLPLVVNSALGSPVLELLDGAQASLGSASGPTLTVGRGASGSLRVLAGSDLSVHDFNAVLGDSAAGNGTLEVDQAGSTLTVDNTLTVGREGSGTLDIGGGAQATIGSLRLATQIGAEGTGTIRDALTSVHVSDYFEMCGTPSSGSPTAVAALTVSGGASLWLERAVDSGHLWTGSELVATGGAGVHIAGQLQSRGTVRVEYPATISGGVIKMATDSRISGWGVISSAILADADSSGRIQPSGTLTLGDAASPTGFHFVGSIDMETGDDIALVDADSAVVGTVNLQDGRLFGPSRGIYLSANHRIAGYGTVDGDVRVAGSLIPQGLSGLTFNDAVRGTGQGINGTRVRFAPGSSFAGNGAIAATVVVDTGAVFLPDGALTLGNSPLASSVTVDGVISVAAGAGVTFSATDSTRVSGRIELAGANVTSLVTSPLVVRPAGRISGRGSVLGPTYNGGTLDPGLAGAPTSLEFAALTMLPGSHVAFDVGDWAAGVLDTISSSAAMTLAGSLDLHSLPGFLQVAGDSFPVLSYSSRAGTFSDMTLNGQPAAGQLLVVYAPTRAWVKMLVSSVGVGPGGATLPRMLNFSAAGSPARVLKFTLELPENARATVELFDVSGRRLGTLHDGALPAGRHVLEADPAAAASGGLYFARATVRGAAGTVTRTARAVRLR